MGITQTVLKKTPQKTNSIWMLQGPEWLLNAYQKKTLHTMLTCEVLALIIQNTRGILSLLSLRDVLADRTNFDGFSNLWILKWITVNPILSCTLFWTIYEKFFCYRIIDFSADYKHFMFWLNWFALWLKSTLSLRQLRKFRKFGTYGSNTRCSSFSVSTYLDDIFSKPKFYKM